MHRDLYLVCYDISSPRRWRKVHALLSSYRVAGQKSVSECLMTRTEVREVIAMIDSIIDRCADRVHVLQLDPRVRVQVAGVGATHRSGAPICVV